MFQAAPSTRPSLLPTVLALAMLAAPALAGSPRQYRETPDDPPAARAAKADLAARSARRTVAAGSYVSVQVNVDAAGMNIVGDAANEPSIAVDPTDPLNLVIGWRQFDSVASNFRQAGWAYSRDGGRTWTFPGVLEPGVFRSDPVLDADSSGRVFFQSLEVTGGGELTNDVWRSLDAGASWLAPVEAFGGDKNWMAVDRTGGPGDGHVYATWTGPTDIRPCVGAECCSEPFCCAAGGCCTDQICFRFENLSRSVDGGDSYQPPVAFAPDDVFSSVMRFPTLAVGAEGELYAGGELPMSPSEFLVQRSDDARDAGSSPTFTASEVRLGGALGFRLAPNPAGLLGQVEVDADLSAGPHRGNVYLLASVVPDAGGDPMDVHFVRSTDGGATWSAPVRVNDDPAGNGAWQWFGALSVAPNGRLDAVWNDTRASGLPTVSELTYAYSWDGGTTWSPNVAASPPWDSTLGWPNQQKIGDYYDLVSDEHGAAVAWAATFNGEQDVYFLRLFPDCNGNGVSDVADVAGGASSDYDASHVPDECEPLELAGPEPGVAGGFNAWTVGGAIPGHRIRFLRARGPGSSPVPGCPALESGLDKPAVLGQGRADGAGTASLRRRIPGRFAGATLLFQALDADTCAFLSRAVSFTFP